MCKYCLKFSSSHKKFPNGVDRLYILIYSEAVAEFSLKTWKAGFPIGAASSRCFLLLLFTQCFQNL